MSEYIIDMSNSSYTSQDNLIRFDFSNIREEIVRCRDCKHRYEGMCMLTDGMGDFKRWFVDDDDYCSDGEKVVGE